MPLEFLNDFFSWIVTYLPNLELMQANYGGVKFLPGGKVKVVKPGLYWYWPLTTTVEEIPIKRQSIEVQQELTTKDGETVMVKTVIVFTVDDIMKALVETTDFDDTVEEMGQKGTVAAIMSRDFDQIVIDMVSSNDIRNEVAQGARSALRPFGVKVEDAFISSFGETKIFSHAGEGAFGFAGHEED